MALDRSGLTLLLALLAAPAAAGPLVHHEVLDVLGWNKDCSIAVSHLGYPPVGDAIADEPVRTLIGTLTIRPGEEDPEVDWKLDWEGKRSWQPALAKETLAELKSEGYGEAGPVETVRPGAVEDRDLPRLLYSTDTFKTKGASFPDGYPGEWRLSRVHYRPLDASCALLVFEPVKAVKDRPFYRLALIRVGNAGIRGDRALAHDTNGLLLLEHGDRDGALAETAIGAKMAPENALARYTYARLLSLSGRTDQALDELERAVALDGALKKKARREPDFQDISWMPRFKDLSK